jgi:hypothetical protein
MGGCEYGGGRKVGERVSVKVRVRACVCASVGESADAKSADGDECGFFFVLCVRGAMACLVCPFFLSIHFLYSAPTVMIPDAPVLSKINHLKIILFVSLLTLKSTLLSIISTTTFSKKNHCLSSLILFFSRVKCISQSIGPVGSLSLSL